MRLLWLVSVLALVGGCRRATPGAGDRPAPPPVHSAGAPSFAGKPGDSVDLLESLGECDIEHRGLFLDLGTAAVDARREHTIAPRDDVVASERGGVSVARTHTKRLAYEFSLLAPEKSVGVTVRVIGVASRQVNVYIDDRRLGAAVLPREDLGFVTLPPLDGLAAGTHTITLRFSGSAQGADDQYADVDWIRIGSPDPAPETYGAPTRRDIVTDVVLDSQPKRALVLRSPGSVRCPVRVTPGMRFTTELGYWGTGKGLAQVRLFEDGETPVVLAERRVSAGPDGAWTPVSIALEPYVGRVVSLELLTADASGGGRVAFGEPALVGPAVNEVAPSPSARVVVVVLAAGLDRRLVPPWGPVGGLGTIGRLVREGAAFDRYRAPTTVVSGVVATLLSGLAPRAHGVEDTQSRLPDEVRLIGERAKEGNVHAAFFTGVPTSFPPFGFDRGWERYEAFSPVKDVPATEPLSQGAAWLKEQLARDEDGRFLLVVHARGGHPPWDVTREEVQLLPPEEYGGQIEPRAGALVLANLRVLKGPADQRLSGDDWRRLRALEEAGLKKQDIALRRIVEVLEKAGVYDRSLIVVVGDVATGDPPTVPFTPVPALREDVLMPPLIVKFPGALLAGKQVATTASTIDVTETLLAELGLSTEGVDGVPLDRLARGALPVDGRPLVATLGNRYSTRWGPWLLTGDIGRRPTLCLVEVDPSCATDAFEQSPLAAAALWRRTFAAEVAARALRTGGTNAAVRTTLDLDTQSALKVFGY